MESFNEKPEDEELKKEYFKALKDEFGSDDENRPDISPYMRHRPGMRIRNPLQRSNTMMSPNSLYPGDRMFPHAADSFFANEAA